MELINIPLALKELGIRPVLFNAIYRLKILSGYYRLTTPTHFLCGLEQILHGRKKRTDIYLWSLIRIKTG